MTEHFTYEDYQRAADVIRERFPVPARVGLILGSGVNPLADDIAAQAVIPYAEIPHFPCPSIEGHVGRLVCGTLENVPILCLQGRAHYYEGVSMAQVTFPVRVLQLLGVDTLIVTNAAGGLNPDFEVGDLMVITDHIGFTNLTGLNPLRGPNDERLGPRFPDMTHAYDRELIRLAMEAAREAGVPLYKGIYVGLSGPSFETPAELRFLRAIGGDAVGMSTVPEVTVARHAGMRVLGISGISNIAIFDPDERREASHEEVLEAGRQIAPRLRAVIRGVLRRLYPS